MNLLLPNILIINRNNHATTINDSEVPRGKIFFSMINPKEEEEEAKKCKK